MRSKSMVWIIVASIVMVLAGVFIFFQINARAEPDIFASPINAGCYIAGPNDCRFHVEPFTINLQNTPSTKLVLFRIVANPAGGSSQVIYDFRPDLSNPPMPSDYKYTPSLVGLDYAASCGKSYSLSLQGADSSNPNTTFLLGKTGDFICPSGIP